MNLKLTKEQSKSKNTDSIMQGKITEQLKLRGEESSVEGFEGGGNVRQNQRVTWLSETINAMDTL